MKCYKIFVLIFFVFEGVAALPSPPDGLLPADAFTPKSRANADDSKSEEATRSQGRRHNAKRPETLLNTPLSKAHEEDSNDNSDSRKLRDVEFDVRHQQEAARDLSPRTPGEDTTDKRHVQKTEHLANDAPVAKRDRESKLVKSGIAVTALGAVGGLYALLKKLVFDKNKGTPDEGPYPQPGAPSPTPRSLDDEAEDGDISLTKRDRRARFIKALKVGGATGTLAGLWYALYSLMTSKDDGPNKQPAGEDAPSPAAAPAPRRRGLDDRGEHDLQRPLTKRDGRSKLVKGGIAVTALAAIGGLYGLLKKLVFDKNKGTPDEGPYPQPGTPAPTPRSLEEDSQDINAPLTRRDRRKKLIRAGKIGGAAATTAALYYLLYRLMTGKSDGRQKLPPNNVTPGPTAAPTPRRRRLYGEDDQDSARRSDSSDDGATSAQRRPVKRADSLHRLHKAAQGGALVISLGALYYLANQMLKDSKAERQHQQGQQGHHRQASEPVSAPAPRPRSLDEDDGPQMGATLVARHENDFALDDRGMSGAQKGLLRIGGATTAMMTMASLASVAQKQKQQEHKQEKGSAKAQDKAQRPQPQRQIPVLRPRGLNDEEDRLLDGKHTVSNGFGQNGAQLDKRLKGSWGKTVGGGMVGLSGLGMESLYAANALKKKKERQQKAYEEAKKYGPALMIKKSPKYRR